VVHFSVFGSKNPAQFTARVQEQLIVYDMARNQLVDIKPDNDKVQQNFETYS
jgi:hypothetical protein